MIKRIVTEVVTICGHSLNQSVTKGSIDTYPYPWDLDYSIRLRMLDKGSPKIAYYYGKYPDSSSYRYRVYNMVQVWQTMNAEVAASYFHMGDIDNLTQIFAAADIIVICRAAYCHRIGNAIVVARAAGKRVIYDIDDLVFDTRYVRTVLETIGTSLDSFDTWNSWFGDFSRHGAVLEMCDGVTTTNNFLAEKIREYRSIQVFVIPNYLNQEQVVLANALYQQKRILPEGSGGNRYLGYFSGTRTHNRDFAILTDALINIFDNNSNVRLKIVGLLDLDEKLRKYKNRIEILPFQNYLDLERQIASVDINLIPLQLNDFTNSKSELKYFEAGIVGTVSIASPAYIYRQVIRDGWNGYIANPEEWQQKIQKVLDDTDNYRIVANNAYLDAVQHYSWDKMAGPVERIFLRNG